MSSAHGPRANEIGWQHWRQFGGRNWRLLTWFFLCSAARTGGTVASIFLVHSFLASVLADPTGSGARLTAAVGPRAALGIVASVLLAVFVVSGLAAFASQTAMQRLVRRFELDLVERIVGHLVRLDLGFFDSKPRGDLVESVRQDVSRTRLIVSACTDLAVATLQAVAYAAAALWLSPRLTLIALSTLLVAATPGRWVGRGMAAASRRARARGYRLTDVLFQLLQGMRTIKVYRREDLEASNVIAASRNYQRGTLHAARIKATGDVIVETAANLGVVVVIIVGGLEVTAGRLSTSALVATLVALRAIHGPLNNAAARLMDIQANRSSFERIRDLLRVEPAVADRPEAVPFADSLNALRFEDVGFRYGAARDVLRHVSFEVRRGQRVGIVGPSGSGKTTLLHVVARLYDPTTGRVVVNGRDLRDYRIADWHDRVAVVTQDSFVFTTTVRENIRYGRLDASPEDVERAAVDAAIHGDIVRLPLGYDTVLGVGGHTLSSGQVQRISLARALLKNAELLLLDEATSNLDAIADAQLREAVDRLRRGRTTIAVAHRLASVSDADLILVVDGGVIVATGTHQSLLTTCPLYAALWRSQFADIEHAASTHPGDSASVGASA